MTHIPFFLAVAVAAAFGAMFRPGAWYESLRKPAWTPPSWAFPVVWAVLYIMIALAGWLIWRAEGWGSVMYIWAGQLVLNAAWSWLFFGRKRMDLAFADIVALWCAIAAFLVLAAATNVWAALMFACYLAWVSVAVALNWSIWRLNLTEG